MNHMGKGQVQPVGTPYQPPPWDQKVVQRRRAGEK